MSDDPQVTAVGAVIFGSRCVTGSGRGAVNVMVGGVPVGLVTDKVCVLVAVLLLASLAVATTDGEWVGALISAE